MKNARLVVYDALFDVFKNSAYSNITLNKHLNENRLSQSDKAFATALFYGTIQRTITLDYIISRYFNKKLTKLDLEILIILRMGVFQLLYLNSVPDMAAVNESVLLVSYVKKASAKGLVNAILRAFIRDNKTILLKKDENNSITKTSLEYSCPEWIIKKIATQYDMQTAIEFAKSSVEVPPLVIRVNTIKTTTQELLQEFFSLNIDAVCSPIIEDCIILKKMGDLEKIQAFSKGKFYIQDTASQLCMKLLGAKPGQTVLDICSAPGSKAFTIANYMQNQGEIFAFDIYEHKLALINKSAAKLGINIIKTDIGDGSVYNPDIPKADRVLCDVPCSGLGIIRRKPEIKFKSEESINELPKIQLDILTNAANYVKPGGILVYSTCTVNKNENLAIINKFIAGNSSFKPLQLPNFLSKIYKGNDCYITLFPHIHNCDGFFMAAFKKSEE
ncbi:MAG: 16S rRNA (cytosine(967)-C(5))-methyltransferase RsmB [Oscillospiraceae bacterium]